MTQRGRRMTDPVFRRRCRDCRAGLPPQHMWLCSDCLTKRIERSVQHEHSR